MMIRAATVALALLSFPIQAQLLFPGVIVAQTVPDGKIFIDGAMAAGSAHLTAASAPFAPTDVGKQARVGGAGSGGSTLFATVASFNSPTDVTLSAANVSGGNVTGTYAKVCSDNVAAIYVAISGLGINGGKVIIPPGINCSSSVNATGRANLTIAGVGACTNNPVPGTYAGIGSVIVPLDGDYPLIDFTGSSSPLVEDLCIGHSFDPVVGRVGIFAAQDNSGLLFSERLMINRSYVTGQWGAAALMSYGVSIASVTNSVFRTYGTNPVAVVLSSENYGSITSAHRAVATGVIPQGGAHFKTVEMHAQPFTDVVNSGVALRMIGHVGQSSFIGVSFDAQTNAGTIRVEPDSNGNMPANHLYAAVNIYSEYTHVSDYCWVVTSGTYATIYLAQVTRSCTTGKLGNMTPATAWQGP